MEVALIGGTGQQRKWLADALASITYPLDQLDVGVTFSWPEEPSLPGHTEWACTHVTDEAHATVEIRNNLDTTEAKDVYIDVVAHEIGHVFHFTHFSEDQREAQTTVWTYDGPDEGDRGRAGTPDDLNPLGKVWADRIQEAWAEVWKDTFVPEALRFAENRSNWRIPQAEWAKMFVMPDDELVEWEVTYLGMPESD